MRGLIVGAAFLALSSLVVSNAQALTTAFVDFENNPSIAQGPSLFASAGAMQTITVPGVATFTGGVVLGNATNLPALSFSTVPNIYGTAVTDASLGVTADPSLLSSLTIAIDPSYEVTEVSFPLFNGNTVVTSYTVTAFEDATQIGQQVLSDLPSNSDSGHGVVDLKTVSDITSVTITPSDTAVWDFFIDSVAFNEPVSGAITPGGNPITQGGSAVPLPSAASAGIATLAGLGMIALVRSRRKNLAV